jgi:two-component system cell cycle sensor histidine kinase/response regulator CckA
MFSTLSPLAAVSAVAAGSLVLAALGGRVLGRVHSGPGPRASALFLGALAVAGVAQVIAPLSEQAQVVGACFSAVLAWCGVAALWRAPDLEQAPPGAAESLLDVALAACGDGVAIVTTSADGVAIVYSNPAFEHLTGYTNEEALGLSPSVLVDEQDSLTAVRAALRGTEAVRLEVPGRRKDGARVWAEWHVVPVTDGAGRHTHSVAVLRDTTRRRRAEHALRESEARFRGLFEYAADAIFVLDRDSRIVDANPQACLMLDHSRAELTALTLYDLQSPTGSSSAPATETHTVESTFCRKDGGTVAVEIRYATCEHDGSRLTLAMVRDVTRRRRAEHALREREELLRDIIAHIPCGVFWKDRDSVYRGCNEQVARDHGLRSPEQVLGQTDYGISCNEEEATFYRNCDREVIESGRPLVNIEATHTRLDGTRASLLTSKVPMRDARGRVVGVLGVYTDITELKRLEEQLRHAQKMEAVGRLAGGIAHDFNNLLTVIRGNADLLRPSAEGPGPQALLEDLELAADRATALVRQLLLFSRRQPVRVEVLDLNEVVTALVPLLKRLLGDQLALEPALARGPATVRADRSHLEQVVMNLAVNAKDAMPAGGTLTVRIELAERPTAERPARFVRLVIADTGTGMPADVRARIFEPFFTTKGPERGTGLGLATVFGIVQQAGGHIDVESAPGVGTTFRVDLPWWSGGATDVIRTPAPRAVPERKEVRPTAVLLVEDQEPVRNFARLALQGAGHTVTEADCGESALELLGSGSRFDVLLTDVSMPGIDGHELAQRVRAERPDVAVVIMSGYAPDTDRTDQVDRSVFLQKPFPPADLIAALQRALRLVRRPARKSV